jgi:hypothetical protein
VALPKQTETVVLRVLRPVRRVRPEFSVRLLLVRLELPGLPELPAQVVQSGRGQR